MMILRRYTFVGATDDVLTASKSANAFFNTFFIQCQSSHLLKREDVVNIHEQVQVIGPSEYVPRITVIIAVTLDIEAENIEAVDEMYDIVINPSEPDNEPPNIDDDSGYDPYTGQSEAPVYDSPFEE